MPFASLDTFAAPLQWAAFDAASNPSIQIALAAETAAHPQASTADSMRAEFGSSAVGHVLRRTFAALDLSEFADLTLWARSSSRAGADPGSALRLRLELGSAALPIGAPGNSWHRYLFLPQPNAWSYLQFALDDLPAAVRDAVTMIEIAVVDCDSACSLQLDGLEAQSRTLAADAQETLLNIFDGKLVLGGTPVPAVIAPDAVPFPAQPHFLLTLAKSAPSPKRALGAGVRSDYTDEGYRVRGISEPWDLFYGIGFGDADAANAVQLRDFATSRYGVSSWLAIGNRAWRIEPVDSAQVVPDAADADPLLYLRIAAWTDRSGSTAVRAANDVTLVIGPRASVGVGP